jgi:hypothetical protein
LGAEENWGRSNGLSRTPFTPILTLRFGQFLMRNLSMSQLRPQSYPVGKSPIESLPSELLHKILVSVSLPSRRGASDTLSHKLPGNLTVPLPNPKFTENMKLKRS